MFQLLAKEQHYAAALQFAVTRFVSALAERKDLLTPQDHRILFQNSEEVYIHYSHICNYSNENLLLRLIRV